MRFCHDFVISSCFEWLFKKTKLLIRLDCLVTPTSPHPLTHAAMISCVQRSEGEMATKKTENWKALLSAKMPRTDSPNHGASSSLTPPHATPLPLLPAHSPRGWRHIRTWSFESTIVHERLWRSTENGQIQSIFLPVKISSRRLSRLFCCAQVLKSVSFDFRYVEIRVYSLRKI